ncbi:hypothetical protein [Burkholderia multivorans]|uniref:hypothetical protein n=1 Tax=Burkholderia TaxID=32008 RepID=UPI002018E203|nr:hypothetical protein [Burkholderia multivorans]MCL4653009.1 hypothetical protein [Burkholderia multivorans]MCL4656888.1 hypothetical protein [Burkholderia multivorans]MCO1427517.1 hypothetical protein [Burkholderia multivorans]UQN52847.1 hypothetical protein L0Y88_01790 [Burkholderia multivorans]UQN82806.1 hypothetical protein L0Z18_26820 [Burkholderia multivorans]
MTDFADAFKRGQDAAARAAEARAEVDQVVTDVRQSVFNETNGRVEIGQQRFEKPRKRSIAEQFATSIALLTATEPTPTELWLAARNPLAIDASWEKLAKFERPHEGYPCVVSYDNRDVRCHDRSSLEDAIAELLASSWGGETLFSLLNRPLKPRDATTEGA